MSLCSRYSISHNPSRPRSYTINQRRLGDFREAVGAAVASRFENVSRRRRRRRRRGGTRDTRHRRMSVARKIRGRAWFPFAGTRRECPPRRLGFQQPSRRFSGNLSIIDPLPLSRRGAHVRKTSPNPPRRLGEKWRISILPVPHQHKICNYSRLGASGST